MDMKPRVEKSARPWTQWSGQDLLLYFRGFDRRQQRKYLVCALGGVLLTVFVVFPAWFQRPQIQNQIAVLRAQIVQGETQIKNHPNLIEERRLCENFIQDIRSRLFGPEEREGLLGVLAGIAKKSGLSLTSTETGESKISKEPFAEEYPTVTYAVTYEGGFPPLADFVSEIENYSKPLVISRLSVTSRAEQPGSLLGQLTVSAVLSREDGTKQP